MPVLLRIAFRNLKEHKSKTLIIGIIIALGISILTIGNSLMDTAARGIQKTFIENYTGHIMVSGKTDSPLSIFGMQMAGATEKVPVIPQYEKVKEYVVSLPEVEAVTSQVTGYAGIELGEERGFVILFGIEPESYRKMFSSIEIIEGRYLEPGEEGILLGESKILEIEKEYDITIGAGDQVILNSFGAAGFKIREVPVRGIFRLKQKTEGLDQIGFIDIQSLRALEGMVVATASDFKLDEEETKLLNLDSPESLFSEDDIVETETSRSEYSQQELMGILGGGEGGTGSITIDSGAWHYLLIKLKNGRDMPRIIAELNSWFDRENIPATAVDWKTAAGGMAMTSDIMKTVFNIAILIVAVVAVIIIMNTLVISVIERTPEIGTIRALGARKSFVWKMFALETFTISVLFGTMGIMLGVIIIGVLNIIGIQATNTFLNVLFGGPVLRPSVSSGTILSAFGIIVLIGFLSHLYPVWVALKIQPVKAIQTEY